MGQKTRDDKKNDTKLIPTGNASGASSRIRQVEKAIKKANRSSEYYIYMAKIGNGWIYVEGQTDKKQYIHMITSDTPVEQRLINSQQFESRLNSIARAGAIFIRMLFTGKEEK